MNIERKHIITRLSALGEDFEIPKPRFDLQAVELSESFTALPHKARAYFIERAHEGPSRKVGRYTKGNVRVQYPSRSMGHSTNCESRTQEQAFYIRAEADPYVIAYFDQPPQVEVTAHDKNGRKRCQPYTPDSLLLTKDGLVVVEVKPADKVHELYCSRPQDWISLDGHAQFQPAVDYFEKLGIVHVVWSPPPGSANFTANLELLGQLPSTEPSSNHPDAVTLLNTLESVRCATIHQLVKSCQLTDLTGLFLLIRDKRVISSIHESLLTDIHSTLVSISGNELDIAKMAQCEFNAIGNAPTNLVSGPALAVHGDLQEAMRKLAVAESISNTRSRRRYRLAIKKGAATGLTPLQSLLPQRKAQSDADGRKKPKRSRIVLDFLKTYIKERIDDIRRTLVSTAYAEYRTDALAFHPDSPPVSLPTFKCYLGQKDQVVQSQKRGGTRLANAKKPPTQVPERAIKASRPFQAATADHYKVDLFCEAIRDSTDQYVASPYLSVLVDIATSYVLAIWLSFANPSRSTCAALLRQCARIHGLWPEAIIVDRGSDFQSVYLESVLADKSIAKIDRPVSDPRYGSEAERFFQGLRSQSLNHLPGNYVYVRDNRTVSSSHHAKKAQLLDLRELIEQCATYAAWRNHHSISSHHYSPSLLLEQGLSQFSFSGKRVVVDDSFYVATAVDDKRYKLDRQRGLHIPPFHYSSPPLFRTTESHVSVRIDPENPYLVYAYVSDQWVPCLASAYPSFSSASDTGRRVIAARQSIPHAILSAQANAATTARVLMIRNTHGAEPVQEGSAPSSASIEPLRVDIEEPSVSDAFSRARELPASALEYKK